MEREAEGEGKVKGRERCRKGRGEGRWEGGSVRYRNVKWKLSYGDENILILIVTSCHRY